MHRWLSPWSEVFTINSCGCEWLPPTRRSVEWRRKPKEASNVALGQKQTSRSVEGMSALPPKADIDRSHQEVHFVPISGLRAPNHRRRTSFRYVVGESDIGLSAPGAS